METNRSDPVFLPKEILDITWLNTSEERLKEAYKIWANTYDKVSIYSISVVVYSPCMLISSQKRWNTNRAVASGKYKGMLKLLFAKVFARL